MFLQSVVHFPFSLLFSPSVCFPPRFLLSSAPLVFLCGCFLLVLPPVRPPPPHFLRSLPFALLCLSSYFTVPLCSPIFLLLRSPFAFVSFVSSPCVCFCDCSGSPSPSAVGYPATGMPLRLGSPSVVILFLAAPASFFMRGGGGGGSDFVLFPLPECILSLSL